MQLAYRPIGDRRAFLAIATWRVYCWVPGAMYQSANPTPAMIVVGIALASGCWKSSEVVIAAPTDVGFSETIAAPPAAVYQALRGAFEAAGLEWEKAVEEGPRRWVAVALVPAGMGGDGQWTRVMIEPNAQGGSRVSVFSIHRGNGIAENPDSTARNVLLNLIVLCTPQAQAPVLAGVRSDALQPKGAP